MAVPGIEFRVSASLPGWTQHPRWESYQTGYLYSAKFASIQLITPETLTWGYLEGVGRRHSRQYLEASLNPYDLHPEYRIPNPIIGPEDPWPYLCPSSIAGELLAAIYQADVEYGWYFLGALVASCSIPITISNATISVDLRPYIVGQFTQFTIANYHKL